MPGKPKKYKIVISKDALWDIKSTKRRIKRLLQALQYIFNLLCRGKFHHYGNPGLERPHVLAIHYKENAENQQINLLQSSRFGEALRIVQDRLNEKNFYAFNPGFDCNGQKEK